MKNKRKITFYKRCNSQFSLLGLILCVTVLLLHFPSEVNAQFYGWTPANSDGAKTITTSVKYDENRAQVTAATNTSGTLYTLTLSNPTGLNLYSQILFSADDWCLMVQMEHTASSGNKIGVNCGVKVISYTPDVGGTSATLNIDVFGSNSWPSFDFGTGSKVQILRVPAFSNVDLNPKGKITCEPYNHDDGTGGIVAFFVSGTLNFNGGIVNVTGKGYLHG